MRVGPRFPYLDWRQADAQWQSSVQVDVDHAVALLALPLIGRVARMLMGITGGAGMMTSGTMPNMGSGMMVVSVTWMILIVVALVVLIAFLIRGATHA